MALGNTLPAQIVDYPVFPQSNWGGYFHKQDPTVISPNVLTGGSFNCFIPDTDKIVTRKGSQRYGQRFTENVQIIGHAKKFATTQGNEFEVRVWPSNDPDLANVVDVSSTVLGTTDFFRITEDVNTFAPAPDNHRYYFDEWYDTDPNNNRVDLARLVWVNGTDKIFSWTGSVVQVLSVTATNIVIDATYTNWETQGFIDIADGGTGEIIVNGVKYTITSGWGTLSVNVGSTTGITAGDWVFDAVREDTPTNIPGSTMIWDYCRTVKDHVHYSNWKTRSIWASNAFNKLSSQLISSTTALLDDMSISGSYTGSVDRTYKVVIDSIASDTQRFIGTGTPIFFDTSGYTGTGSHKYVLKCVFTQIFTCGTYVGTIQPGEPIRGATSGAYGTLNDDPQAALNETSVHTITGEFRIGEVITGQFSGATFIPTAIRGASSVIFFRDDVQIPLSVFFSGNAILDDNGLPRSTPLTLVDGLVFVPNVQNTYISLDYGDYVELTIQSIDTFQWQVDDNSPVATDVDITPGSPQLLQDGISIEFSADTGHALGDSWTITVKPAVEEGWKNFYFSVPDRFPGEGYRVRLPSNFWAMAPQEDFMYVNTQHGQWLYINYVLSADLRTETVEVQPLKQASQNKVLFPYMIGHMDNYLVYVSERKTLDFIGRKELVELPQIGNLSDPVKIDFLAASFTNGSIEYWDKKLWITSPDDGTMFCYDNIKTYWQPPQVIPENGILSIIGDSLVTHSNIRNQTNTLFVGTNDNGSAFTVRMRFPFNDYGSRWESKSYNFTFVEGYMVGAPNITYRVFLDPNGCHGIKEHPISPIMCLPVDRASLGKDYLGSHGLGNDPTVSIPYFQEIYKDVMSDFHFAQIELACETLDQDWSILSVALNAINSNTNNSKLTSNQILIP